MSEKSFRTRVREWLQGRGFHVAALVEMPGWPDFMAIGDGGKVLFLELKKGGNYGTRNTQDEVIYMLKEKGANVVVLKATEPWETRLLGMI